MSKIVVFGGNGFVGSEICKEAVRRGLTVFSVSRQGVKPSHLEKEAWASNVVWAKGDALNPASYEHLLQDSHAAVFSVGSPPLPFVDYTKQVTINGRSGCTVVETCKRLGVRRFVAVGATAPPAITPKGYFDGKRLVEAAAKSFASDSTTPKRASAVLQPAAINGTRTAGNLQIPLWLVLSPLSIVFRLLLPVTRLLGENLKALLQPPVHVAQVASFAVDACVNSEYEGTFTIVSNETMAARKLT